MAFVSFATGWSREYVLHKLTFAEVIRYAEYAQEWTKEQAIQQAIQIGRLFTPPKRKPIHHAAAPGTETDLGANGGADELIRRNTP
ncbi:MAG TPA: hypothetical protein O0X39_01325 [Methanocorpusculum sp.]|nr:hypothetical protein [Methanocorpusculum sp.]